MTDPATSIPPPQSFLDACTALGIAFDRGDVERLERFLSLLLETNRRFNLTRITDPVDAWHRHVYDSLTLLPILASAGAARVIDIGSGGGLPGIVLAIAMPQTEIALVEATGKKARFLRETVEALELENVAVLNERAETIGRDRGAHREHYDAVTARAVGKLPELLELTVPLARVGGLVLAIKGAAAEDEIASAQPALHALQAHVIDVHRTSTGTIVVIEKQRRSPKAYPRQPGEPKRAPIGGKDVGKPSSVADEGSRKG